MLKSHLSLMYIGLHNHPFLLFSSVCGVTYYAFLHSPHGTHLHVSITLYMQSCVGLALFGFYGFMV